MNCMRISLLEQDESIFSGTYLASGLMIVLFFNPSPSPHQSPYLLAPPHSTILDSQPSIPLRASGQIACTFWFGGRHAQPPAIELESFSDSEYKYGGHHDWWCGSTFLDELRLGAIRAIFWRILH